MGEVSLGVDIGGTKTAIGLFDGGGRLVAKSSSPTRQDLLPEPFFLALAEDARAMCERNGIDSRAIAGVGIGAPCFTLQPAGHIIKSSNVPRLRDFPARAFLEREMGVPVAFGNDTHAAALAESSRGAGRGERCMLYCSLSSGIGAAMVVDGKLHYGSRGLAGEAGHMLATPGKGITCDCGKRGCFMSWCSGLMIVRHVQSWIANGAHTSMPGLAGGDPAKITASTVRQAWENGDALAARAVEQMQRYFSVWFYNLYVALNASCFVLGGGLVNMGPAFWDAAVARFRELNDDGQDVSFRFAALGDDAGIIGANAMLALWRRT